MWSHRTFILFSLFEATDRFTKLSDKCHMRVQNGLRVTAKILQSVFNVLLKEGFSANIYYRPFTNVKAVSFSVIRCLSFAEEKGFLQKLLFFAAWITPGGCLNRREANLHFRVPCLLKRNHFKEDVAMTSFTLATWQPSIALVAVGNPLRQSVLAAQKIPECSRMFIKNTAR